MILSPRRKIYLILAGLVFLLHLAVAAWVKPSFALTLFGDGIPCVLLVLAILSFAENFRLHRGVLPLFWKLTAAGLFTMLLSQSYWFYYDSLRRFGAPEPGPGRLHVSSRPRLSTSCPGIAAAFHVRWPRSALSKTGLRVAHPVVVLSLRLFRFALAGGGNRFH